MTKYISIFALLLCFNVGSQTAEYIRSGRPGNANDPYSSGKKNFQIENGLYFYSSISGPSLIGNSLYLRYGILEKFEINLVTDISKYSDFKNPNYGGFNFGVKYNWIDKRFGFGTLLTHDFNNLISTNGSVTALNNSITYQFSEKFGVCFNTKLIYEGATENFGNWFVLNLSRSIGQKRNFVYSEVSTYLSYLSNQNISYFRLGWFKQFSTNFQIDAAFRLEQVNPINRSEYFLGGSVGFSYRFLNREKK